jgi:transcriptional regulator with XRE-family HTH domain
MTFPKALKAERTRLGINQTECAEVPGVSFEALSKWERGLSEPSEITKEGALARLALLKARKAHFQTGPLPYFSRD